MNLRWLLGDIAYYFFGLGPPVNSLGATNELTGDPQIKNAMATRSYRISLPETLAMEVRRPRDVDWGPRPFNSGVAYCYHDAEFIRANSKTTTRNTLLSNFLML